VDQPLPSRGGPTTAHTHWLESPSDSDAAAALDAIVAGFTSLTGVGYYVVGPRGPAQHYAELERWAARKGEVIHSLPFALPDLPSWSAPIPEIPLVTSHGTIVHVLQTARTAVLVECTSLAGTKRRVYVGPLSEVAGHVSFTGYGLTWDMLSTAPGNPLPGLPDADYNADRWNPTVLNIARDYVGDIAGNIPVAVTPVVRTRSGATSQIVRVRASAVRAVLSSRGLRTRWTTDYGA
jgi:hypothetical protein